MAGPPVGRNPGDPPRRSPRGGGSPFNLLAQGQVFIGGRWEGLFVQQHQHPLSVPTTTTWGLVVLALLLLSAGYVAAGLLFGVVPVLSVGLNGFFLGVLYRQASGVAGYWMAMLKVAPHGVFEIPALLFTASYGLSLGVAVFRRVRGRETAPLAVQVNHAFERYFVVAFPLLVVAAAVETALLLAVE